MKWLESVAQTSLAIWVGSMAGFAYTAPLIFRAFGGERGRAGDLAGEIIWRLNTLGLILGAIALLAILPRLKVRLNQWRVGLVAAAISLSLVGAFYIFPMMDQARPPEPIETYAENDPVRLNYNKWHKTSERIFGVAIILGAGALILGPLARER